MLAIAIAGVWFVSAKERQLYASSTVISFLGTILVAAVAVSAAVTRAMSASVSCL
ncbi:hypothetical protein [Caballeronia sp. NK8]|uniref:hypothetical protein n=1 Tax=Caballeronia sp. NK8 TaxID=140098 RepID=UPI001BCD6C83|nr:hypothetical protein [Caballeronia sp. NK8]